MSGKKQQTAAGLFFSMLLRAAVIILGLAIVAFGAFFVMQALKGNTAKDTPATTLDENALTDSQVDDLQITHPQRLRQPKLHRRLRQSVQRIGRSWC